MAGTVGFQGSGDSRAFELPGGERAPAAPAGRARLRYNRALDAVEVSVDGKPYGSSALGSGGVTAALLDTPTIPVGGIVAITAPAVVGPGAKIIRLTSAFTLDGASRLLVTLERDGATILESYAVQATGTAVPWSLSLHWVDEAPPAGSVVYRVVVSDTSGAGALDNRRLSVENF